MAIKPELVTTAVYTNYDVRCRCNLNGPPQSTTWPVATAPGSDLDFVVRNGDAIENKRNVSRVDTAPGAVRLQCQ